MDDGQGGWLARLLARSRLEQGTRVVVFPAPPLQHGLPAVGAAARAPHYPGNRTSTTKYTLLSFLPKSLFEQYR
jgi:hypothetical protein